MKAHRIAVLILVVIIACAHVVYAQVKIPVIVQNTNSQPVPTKVVNTTAIPVNVNNPVTVGNTVPVSGTVSVGNTVPVTGTLTLDPNASVKVTADPAKPLVVKNFDVPGKQPVFMADYASPSDPGNCAVDLFTVPAGKLLVVEYVTGNVEVVSGAAANIYLNNGVVVSNPVHGAVGMSYKLFPLRTPVPAYNIDLIEYGQMIRMYVPAAKVFSVSFSGQMASPTNCWALATGYLVDVQ